MARVTLNSDCGEGFGIYDFGNDEGLLEIIDVANVACGFHASDVNHMQRTVSLAKTHGVAVGAHVSLPDLQGFGRREMTLSREEHRNGILYQVGALTAFLRAEGMSLHHIKPHGVLYGMAARDPEVAEAVADVAEVFGVPVFGLPGSQHETVYARRGVEFVAEFFPDLDYDEDGRLLIPRKAPPVDPELAARRTAAAVETGIPCAGRRVAVQTVCIHSDRANSVAVAQAVSRALQAQPHPGAAA